MPGPGVRIPIADGGATALPGFDDRRAAAVRRACAQHNGHEVHLKPGAGDIDFADTFQRIEGKGFKGHYTNAFGSLDDMLAGRDELVRLARI